MATEFLQFLEAYLWAVSPLIVLMLIAGIYLVVTSKEKK